MGNYYVLEMELHEVYSNSFGNPVASLMMDKIFDINAMLQEKGTGLAVETIEYDQTTHKLKTYFYEVGQPLGAKALVTGSVIALATIIGAFSCLLAWLIGKIFNAEEVATQETIQTGYTKWNETAQSTIEAGERMGWTAEEISQVLKDAKPAYESIAGGGNGDGETSMITYLGWATLLIGGGVGAYFLVKSIKKQKG